MSQTDFSKLAHSIRELADNGPIGRSSIYNQIAAGRLRARKIGRRTVILDEDWRAFLANTPVVAPAKSADECSSTTARSGQRGRPRKIVVNAVTKSVEASTEAAATASKVHASDTPEKTGVGS
jgi:hypothetical protein